MRIVWDTELVLSDWKIGSCFFMFFVFMFQRKKYLNFFDSFLYSSEHIGCPIVDLVCGINPLQICPVCRSKLLSPLMKKPLSYAAGVFQSTYLRLASIDRLPTFGGTF